MKNQITLNITDLVYPGKGFARLDGLVFFVPGVIPGETVSAVIKKQHKNYAEAEVVEILDPSPARIDAACPIFRRCPGCCYHHIDYRYEIAVKQRQFIELLNRFGGIDASKVLSPIPSLLELGYRNKIVLHIEGNTERRVLGYIGYDNITVVDVSACPLAIEPINGLLSDLSERQCFVHGFVPGDQVVLRYTEQDGAIYFKKDTTSRQVRLVESTLLGPVEVPLTSFFQVNRHIADRLLSRVIDLIKMDPPEWVIDLYCGVGVFTMAALQAGVTRVAAIDTDGSAVRAAEENAKRYFGFTTGLFRTQSADSGLREILKQIDSSRCVLILDPPRRGISSRVIQAIAANPPRRILYISCAPDSLARDIARLRNIGYAVEHTQLFDMFPRTAYFESLTLLKL